MQNKKRVMLVFGTRPEAIKMAPLVKEFEKYPNNFDVKVCVTAQHREMLDQVLSIFDIQPDYDLNIMKQGQDLYEVTLRVLLGMRDVLYSFSPDLVLVHGDTTTSTISALAAFYQHIKIAHIEAGLRTYNLASPWPEEMNRQVTDRLCDYYFAPTEISKANLLRENIDESKIHVTGNTVIDALLTAIDIINLKRGLKAQITKTIKDKGYSPSKDRRLILVTGHRRENFGDGFLNICRALKELALLYHDIDIVYPVHLNPNVQKPVYELLTGLPNIYLIPPLDYLPFIYLMQQSYIVLTDSGGVQEEAPSLGKPVLVMRNNTERPEAVKAGTVKLVGTKCEAIVNGVCELLSNASIYNKMSLSHNPYGDGQACTKIVNALL